MTKLTDFFQFSLTNPPGANSNLRISFGNLPEIPQLHIHSHWNLGCYFNYKGAILAVYGDFVNSGDEALIQYGLPYRTRLAALPNRVFDVCRSVSALL